MEKKEVLEQLFSEIVEGLDEMDEIEAKGDYTFESKGELIRTAGKIRNEYHEVADERLSVRDY